MLEQREEAIRRRARGATLKEIVRSYAMEYARYGASRLGRIHTDRAIITMITMSEIAQHIEAFGATISGWPVREAQYRPEASAQPTSCFENVRQKVEQAGGKIQLGWMFNYRVVEAIPGPGYLIAIQHAAWLSPDGMLIDVTPFHSNPEHHPLAPRHGLIFFLVDDTATVPTLAPLPSRFYPLTDEQRLCEHVERLRRDEDEKCREIYEQNKTIIDGRSL